MDGWEFYLVGSVLVVIGSGMLATESWQVLCGLGILGLAFLAALLTIGAAMASARTTHEIEEKPDKR
jgi:hypothetical protein